MEMVLGDNSDVFPSDSSEWIDTDSDGVGDNSDAFPLDHLMNQLTLMEMAVG